MLRDIRYMLKDDAREQNEADGCRLVVCRRCGKEFYTVGRHHSLCSACQRRKEKKELLDEQYRIAARLGLIKHKK